MTIPLEQWQREVSDHLDKIEAYCEFCIRHVRQLSIRPPFETKAEDLMRQCEATLTIALHRVQRARKEYLDKPTEG